MSYFLMNSVARVVAEPDPKYKHSFGGPPFHMGACPLMGKPPLHLLYTFDTTDPLFPFGVENARFLPLYYCFKYNAGDLSYRVVSDQEIEVLHMEVTEPEKDFPFENYPSEFSKFAVSLVPITYEEQKVLAFHIVCEDHARGEVLSPADKEFIERIGIRHTQIGGIHQMMQGIPEVSCPNDECEDYSVMYVFAVVWNQPIPGIALWESDPSENLMEYSQIIYQRCGTCGAIHVCNRCD